MEETKTRSFRKTNPLRYAVGMFGTSIPINMFKTYETCCEWKAVEYGIKGLISADDDRVCYYHDNVQWMELKKNSYCFDEKLNLGFWKTLLRLEDMENEEHLEEKLEQVKDDQACLIFTHEGFLQEKRIEDLLLACGEHAKKKNYEMGFFYSDL